MKTLLIVFLSLTSISAFAEFLRVEKDIVLIRLDQMNLGVSIKPEGDYASYCSLYAYKSDGSDALTFTIKQGTKLKIVVVNDKHSYKDLDTNMKTHIVSSVLSEIDDENNYLKVYCDARRGTKKVPSAYEVVKLFSEYISLTK